MKRKKNVFCSVLLALTMVMSLLSPTAVQVYAEECVNHDMVYWPEGEKDQWDHKVKCTVCGAWEWENHSYDSLEDYDCIICGYVACAGHSFEDNNYDRDEETHAKECDNCPRIDESTRENHTDSDFDQLCDVCGVCFGAEHSYAWFDGNERDDTCHMLSCSRCKLPEYVEWQDHSGNADGQCNVCGYCMGGVHDFAWKQGDDRDENYHWKRCRFCGLEDAAEAHDTDGENNACSVCGYFDTTVGIRLALRALDAETGTVIDGSEYTGMLDAVLDSEDGPWVENFDASECYLDYTESYTLDFHVNSYCPEGYQLPENVTFTVDAEGSITITSDNAAVTVEAGVTYIIVRLQKVVHEHTYENDCYYVEGDKHYPRCDSCDYYDAENGETHYEEPLWTDHRCDGCGEYVRAWCTPVSATDHYCVNGENCGARLTDLCTDEDENHICDGCNEWMDWLCEDENDDHLCDGANCGLRLSICADDDTDGKCDICGKTFAAVTAQYTAVAYEAEGEEAFASGTLKVTANIAGSITAVWGYGKEQVGVTQRLEADVSADLLFEDVPLYDLDFVELTFTPDDEDASAVTLSHYISEDLVTLDVEALTGFDEETYGNSVADTVINGIPCETLYLRPGAAVTVKVDLLPTDSWQAGEFKRENYRPVGIVEGTEGKFYYEDTAGEIKSADAAIDGDDAISFTLPAEVGDRAWLDIFCTHGECANSNQDHWCDSSICEDWVAGGDGNSDNLCDLCGAGMLLRSDGAKDCNLEKLLDSASDGDIVKLLADSNIASDGYDAVWFEPDEDITVTVDLNGFTLSASESLYLLGVGNGTLKIIDRSESKDGKLCNLQNDGILDLDGGTVDLSGHPDPGGMALINYRNEPAAVSGHTGDPTPIRLILPEGYGVVIETGGETLYTSIIPANSTAVVVKDPVLTLEGESGVLCNAHLIARKVLVAGYLEGQLKAVQVVETVTEEIVLTDEVLAYVSAQGGEVKVFLLNGDYAPNYRVLSSK